MIVLVLNYLLKGAIYSSYYNYITFLLLNLLIFNIVICISSQNIVHSIVFLILSFISLSSTFFLLGLKFAAIFLLLIYVGAITILLLFVLMILDVKFLLFETKFSFKYFYILLVFFFITELLIIIFTKKKLVYYPLYIHIDWMKIFYMQDELLTLGDLLYNKNLFSIFIIAAIMLSVLIGAISMVSLKKVNKKAILFDQLNIDKQRMILYKNKKNINKKNINKKNINKKKKWNSI